MLRTDFPVNPWPAGDFGRWLGGIDWDLITRRHPTSPTGPTSPTEGGAHYDNDNDNDNEEGRSQQVGGSDGEAPPHTMVLAFYVSVKMNDKSKYFDDYINLISATLVNFQFIEEGIRMYISGVFKYIETELSGVIPFHYNDTDIAKDSMGKLINKFEKFNNNNDLIAELKDLIKYRNDFAHRGFLLSYKQVYDEKYLKNRLEDLENVNNRTTNCLSRLHKEVVKIELLKG